MNTLTPQRHRRRLLPILLLPLLLVLSGCMKMHMDFDIKSGDDANMSFEIIDTMGFLELSEDGCGEFEDQAADNTLEQFTDGEGNTGCRASGPIPTDSDDSDFFIGQDGDELVFKMGDVDLGLSGMEDDELDLDDPMMEMFAPDIRISVTFPNKVSYASEGGEISGKTVTWTGFESLTSRLEARSPAKGGLFGGGGSSDKEEPADEPETDDVDDQAGATDTDDDAVTGESQAEEQATESGATEAPAEAESSGFPTWLIVVLGALLLLVILLIIMVARRPKKDSTPDAGQHPGQYQQQYQGQQPGQQQYYAAPGQQPGQYPQQPGYSQPPMQPGMQPGQQARPAGPYDPTQQMPTPPQQQDWQQTEQIPPQQQWDQSQWGQGGGQPPQQ